MLANMVNEDDNLVMSQVTKSEKIEELESMLTAAKGKGKCKILVIDKVPPSLDEMAVSKLEAYIKVMLGCDKVMQDRWHVAHTLAKHFNNFDARYHGLILLGWRDHTVKCERGREAVVDEMLRKGLIAKERKGVRIVRG